jgi:endonuclease/exonuclease/phosphatase family metal-dependent hydrolase
MTTPRITLIKIAVALFASAAAILLIFLFWAHLSAGGHVSYIVNGTEAAPADLSSIKVMAFNIAYGRGAKDDIIVGRRPEAEIRKNLDGIAGLIKDSGADIALLQEVDLASKRTHFIDEAKYLAENAGYPSYACVTNWVKNYVPFPYWPPSNHFGRVKSGQCVLSKIPIAGNERIALPQRRDKPFFYTAFDLTRAVQAVDVVIGGKPYKIFNVHEEAFNIENREEQAAILARLVKDSAGNTIVGGDFNALPQNASMKKNFPDKPEKLWKEEADLTSDRSIKIFTTLAPRLSESLPAGTPEGETFTYPADAPNRRLDYIFFSEGIKAHGGHVMKEAGVLSDHLPVYVELELPKR